MENANSPDARLHRSVSLLMPQDSILQTFSDKYHVPMIAAIQLSYSIVLHHFFEARLYVYVGNGSLESADDTSSNDERQYLVEFQPELAHEWTVFNTLGYQSTSPEDDGLGTIKKPCVLSLRGLGKDEFNQAGTIAASFGFYADSGTTELGQEHSGASAFAVHDVCLLIASGQSTNSALLMYKSANCTDFQAQNFALAFRKTLESVVENPHVLVSEVDLLGQQHRSMIHEWNLEAPRAERVCVHHLVELAAIKYSEKLAITCWDGDLTYGQLDSHANRLASHLVSVYGIGPGHKVPLCFNKSIWAIVSMLAIIKTGAAYCCLDPAHPQARRNFIITALEAPLIITSPSKESLFSEHAADKVLTLDSNLVEHLPSVHGPVLSTVTPQDICVIAFTSGSTGVPKGIVHTHTSMSTGLIGNAPRLAFDKPDTRVFQWSAYTFDISYYEIFGTLMHGGCICSPSDEERLYDVEGAMNRMKCDWVWFTPSFSRFFRRYHVPSLKTLTMGGEKLRVDDVKAWAPRVQVIHLYGPAESITAFAKYVDLTDVDDMPAAAHLSFGGMSNAHGWIVDPNNHNRLSPVGAVGELLIEGPGLFQGYLGDEVRTKAVLLENPTWRASTGLPRNNSIYATGDMVRYMPGGGMACLGRKDGTAKLRGQRLDLGEIESVLRQTGLGDSAEIAVDIVTPADRDQDQDSNQVLVAFLHIAGMEDLNVTRNYVTSMAQTWQSQLRTKLPEFMVPRFYYALASIPYNVSGKLDRRALREMTSGFSVEKLLGAHAYNNDESMPRNGIEEQVESHSDLDQLETLSSVESVFQRLWAEALKKKNIKLDDNFFALGGSSLDVIRLVSWARDEGLLIHFTDIFGNPTLRGMASKATKLSHDIDTNAPEAIKPFALLAESKQSDIMHDAVSQCCVPESDIEDIFPLTPQQHGLWAASLSSDGQAASGSYVAQFPIRLADQIDPTKFRIAWEKVANAVGFMRTRFVQSSTGTYQVVLKKALCSEWKLAHSVDINEYIQYDLKKPLDFGEAVTRYVLLEEQRLVVWTSHHALYDGNSLHLFLYAVAKEYRGENWYSGRSIPFTRFIQHLQVAATSEDGAKSYWQSRYEANRPRATNFPRIPYPTYRPHPSGLCTRRISLEQPQNSTITNANVLRAALALTIARLTGASHVNYLETLDGRSVPVPGVESIIGPTFATVPKNTIVRVHDSAEFFLAEMQRTSSEIIPHSQYGLQKISQISAACAAACQFQTLLVIEPRMSNIEYRDVFDFDEEGGGMHRFNSGCILWKCDLDDRGFDLTANFDEHVIPEHQLQLMMHTFEGTVGFLCSNGRETIPISEILGFHPAVYSSAIVSPHRGLKVATNLAAHADAGASNTVGKTMDTGSISSSNSSSDSSSISVSSPTSYQASARAASKETGKTNGTESSLSSNSSSTSTSNSSPNPSSASSSIPASSPTSFQVSAHAAANEAGKMMGPGSVSSSNPTSVSIPTSSPVSAMLEKAWLDTLGLDSSRFSIHDNFFHCGGNSVRAMEFVAIARRSGVSITVAKVFQNPCFKDLAAVATNMSRPREADTGVISPLSFLGPSERQDAITSTAISQCRVDISQVEEIFPATQLQAEFMASLQVKVGAFMAQIRYDIPDNVSVERFQSVWEKLHGTYPILRTRLIRHSIHEIFQVVIKAPVEWTLSTDMSKYLVKDRNIPTGYGERLARYAIVKPPTGPPAMVWTIIHSLYDGFTLKILHHAMGELLAGRSIKPVPSSVPFIKHLISINKEAEASYWRRYLSGYVAHKPFPTLPDAAYSPRADTIKTITIQLPAKNGRSTITMSTMYIAAWALVASHSTAQDDVVFGFCPSGRSAPVQSIADIMMPTVAHVPIRVRISHEQPIGRFLQGLQVEQSDMIAWEQAGLATISTYSESCHAALSTFQSMLIIQNQASATITGGGEDMELYREEVGDNTLFNDRALMIYIAPNPASGTAEVYFSYDSCVVQDKQVTSFARQLEHILGALTAEGDEVTLSALC